MTTRQQADLRRDHLNRELDWIRQRTFSMVGPLTDDDLQKQHLSIMSPIVWDMGHIANFEELWLLREAAGRDAHDPRLDDVYNPFDNPRWCRGDLPMLMRDEATEYLDEVRGDVIDVLSTTDLRTDDPLLHAGYVFDMVVQHEAQHQETVLQALDLRPDLEPYAIASARVLSPRRLVDDEERIEIPGGPFLMGTTDRQSAYDNERPQHEVHVDEFWIDRFPVTVGRFERFVNDGGYERQEYWTDEGWEWLEESGVEAPQGWTRDVGGGWLLSRFGHIRPVDRAEPVEHVNYHEATAFARWAGGRLPTEAEWEKAAAWDPAAGRSRTYPWGEAPPTSGRANLDHQAWGPVPVGSLPAGASAYGVEQMLGDGYEWTTSHFLAYPGYTTFPYPEYSEVFFGEEYRVLRGASWATSRVVARNSFRNWDYDIRRQIFSGIRMAWDTAARSDT